MRSPGIVVLLAVGVPVALTGCVNLGCQQVPAPLLVPVVAVAAPILLVRGDFSHGKDPTYDVTDLVGADLAATRALARDVTATIPSHFRVDASSAGTLRTSYSTASVQREVNAELARRRGRAPAAPVAPTAPGGARR